MYDQPIVQITRAENGYSLRVLVPEEESEDDSSEMSMMGCCEYKTAVFKTAEEVVSFLSALLPAYPVEKPEPEEADFDTMFTQALRG